MNTDYTGYSDGAEVVFNPVNGGFLDLIVAEDAGLDPFHMSLCSDSGCTNRNIVFTGFDSATKSALLGQSDFSGGDSATASEMDQAFVFRFDTRVSDHVAIKCNGRFGGQKLELGFVGVGSPAPVPIPAAAPLFDSAVGLLGLLGWRRRRAYAGVAWPGFAL